MYIEENKKHEKTVEFLPERFFILSGTFLSVRFFRFLNGLPENIKRTNSL